MSLFYFMKPCSILHRATSLLVLLAYAGMLAGPAFAAAKPPVAVASLPSLSGDWAPPPPVKTKQAKINRKKDIKPPSFKAAKLSNPTLDDLNASRTLKVPLRALRGKNISRKDNEDLAKELKLFTEERSGSQALRIQHLERFLEQHPDSYLAASVHLDVAMAAAASADFILAGKSFLAAWLLLKSETADPDLLRQAETALGNLALVYAKTGQKQALEALLEEIKSRPSHLVSVQMLQEARTALHLWETDPLASLECGVTAYNFVAEMAGEPRLSKHGQAWGESEEQAAEQVAANLELIEKGLAASDLLERIINTGTEYKLVKRISGDSVPVPSIVHFKFGEETGHYSALLSRTSSQSFLKDPHLGIDGLVENRVINKMTSGYFIVSSSATLPEGFEAASNDETFIVRGRTSCPNGTDKEDGEDKCPKSCGMPVYDFSGLQGSLMFYDTPLTYRPVYGPGIDFTLIYRERSMDYDDVTAETSSFGPGWSHGLFSYITAQNGSPLPASSNLKWKRPNGSFYQYTWNGTAFTTRYTSRPALTPLPADAGYKLTFPDNSTLEFAQGNGAVITRFYLTKITDAQGYSLVLSYDSQLRLASVTDATGKVTTFEYSGTGMRIQKIVDPYSREAVFAYTSSGMLEKLTDTLGLESTFTYSDRDVTELKTPYGKHIFGYDAMSVHSPGHGTAAGTARTATDPQGDEQRCIYLYHDGRIAATAAEPRPPASITVGATATPFFPTVVQDDHFHVTLTWTKKYWREYLKAKALNANTDPYNYAAATLWLMNSSGYSTPVPHARRQPGLAMEWYNYPGQTAQTAFRIGTDNQPIRAARQTDQPDNANVALRVQWVMNQWTYNEMGMPLTYKDEVGRTYAATYATNNIDLTSVRVTSATGGALQLYGSHTRHLPGTVTEANGLVNTYTRNTADQVTQVVTSKGTNIAESSRYTYDLDGQGTPDNQPGYLMKFEQGIPSTSTWSTLAQFTYDGFGRVASHTDETGYTRTFDYDDFDRLTLITHPDTTTEQFAYTLLDQTARKDRAGRWVRTFYNSIRQPVLEIAWDGKATRYEWCRCGKLYKLIDPAGRVTEWKLDTLGRVVEKIMPDGTTKTTYAYQGRSGRLSTVTRPKDAGSGPTVTYLYYLDGSLKKEDWKETANTLTADVTYSYEAAAPGRLTNVADGIGTTNALTYTALVATPVAATAAGAGQQATYDSDFANEAFTYAYDWQGRRTGSSLAGAVAAQKRDEFVSFDYLGRTVSYTNNIGGSTLSYSDLSSRPSGRTVGSILSQTFTYFPNNATGTRAQRLQSITHNAPLDNSFTVASKHTYDYDSSGRLAQWQMERYGSPWFTHDYGYNLSDELTSHQQKNSSTNALIQTLAWSYDAVGNWLSHGRSYTGFASMTTRTHDVMNRLTSQGGNGHTILEGKVNEQASIEVTAQGDTAQVPLTADPAGGYRFRAQVAVTAGTNTVGIKATDQDNEVTNQTWEFTAATAGTSYTYDLNGNMLTDGTRTFTWDAKDRLRTVAVAGTTYHWDYDWQDNRVREFEYPSGGAKPATATKQFLWDGSHIVRERTGGNVITRTYFTGGFAENPNMDVRYVTTTDHLGNVREIIASTATDAATFGDVMTRYDYDAYLGITVDMRRISSPEVDTNLRVISGYYHHAATGLELAKYRAYDPKLGRFISEDPIQEAGGLNLYRYVTNSPLSIVDSLGLKIKIPGFFNRRKVNKALNKLRKNPDMNAIITHLEKSSCTYTIKLNNNHDDSFEHFANIIHWDPNSSLDLGGGKFQPPYVGLGHELDHTAAYDINMRNYFKRVNTPDESYGNAEEKRVIEGSEASCAKQFGEPTRSNHSGTPVHRP